MLKSFFKPKPKLGQEAAGSPREHEAPPQLSQETWDPIGDRPGQLAAVEDPASLIVELESKPNGASNPAELQHGGKGTAGKEQYDAKAQSTPESVGVAPASNELPSAQAEEVERHLCASQTPVFIVGSPRSGTSILTDAMLSAGYNGFREGNFLALLTRFQRVIDQHKLSFGSGSPQVMATRVDWSSLEEDVAAVLKRQVDTLNPQTPWMDKSGNPEMIEAIPRIQTLWPSARFVFAKRRGIENVLSRQKKFPSFSFEYHCRDWAKNMTAWRAVRDGLGESAIEIDQQEIIKSPALVATRIAAFLNLDTSARERVEATFTNGRPQQTSSGSAALVTGLDQTDWDLSQRETFLQICGPEMEAYNYSNDQNYWENTL